MAAVVNVSGRLDEGQAAVDTIAEYVWACHLLGYSHPDLTRYRFQVRGWYDAEDGLDLRLLDSECTALTMAAARADDALTLQDNHFRALSQAWQGAGAQASTDFLTRHATAAAQVVTGIRSAAAALARLRDSLWHAVDAKVAAAVQIEGRRAGQRGAWLAAARTVSSGVGDSSAASELIDTQVKPFVANDIGADWLTAMRSTTAAVAEAYADAIAALRAQAMPVFGIPGQLGPTWVGPSVPAGVGTAAAPATAAIPPASAEAQAWPSPAPAMAAVPAAMSAGAPIPVAPVAPSPAAEPLTPVATPAEAPGLGQSLGGGGLPGLGGMSDLGSGLAGTGQQLADLFSGLLGSSADGLPDDLGDLSADDVADQEADEDADSDDSDDSDGTDGTDGDEDSDEEDGDGGDEDPDETDETSETDGAEPPEPDDVAEVVEPQSVPPPSESPAPVAVTPPPLVPEPAPAEPMAASAGETPCEIAADELPQAGP